MSAASHTTSLIARIMSARNPEDLFEPDNWKKQYLEYLKLLHPDLCPEPGAEEAVKMLNLFRDALEAKNKLSDDAGSFFRENDRCFRFAGEPELLERSFGHFRWLNRLDSPAALHFKRYLPENMKLESGELKVYTRERVVPLSGLQLPQHHVSWILSRLFEFSAWLHSEGYCHAGINPESIFVAPKTHGIVCMSFYHLGRLNQPLKSLSGRYLHWYPAEIFDRKTAIPFVDLGLVQRTAVYLLGDPSGNGIKLKKDNNPALIDFLIAPHNDAWHTYEDYRRLLRNLFGKPVFHNLNI